MSELARGSPAALHLPDRGDPYRDEQWHGKAGLTADFCSCTSLREIHSRQRPHHVKARKIYSSCPGRYQVIALVIVL